MSKIYFATDDNSIIDSDYIKKVVKIVTGKDIHDADSIRQFAKFCGGIVKEVKKPSVKFLLKHGDKISAIRLYRDTHDGISLKGAMDAVNQIQKDMGIQAK